MGFLKVDLKKVGMFAAGGAIAGALTYEVDKYAKTVKEGATKENIEFLAKSPYWTGVVVGLAGLFLANYGVSKNQGTMSSLGFGMVAGGVGSALYVAMPNFEKK